MYAARTALHMMPPAQTEHQHSQRRNNSNSVHNTIPATPPLLQHYKIVSKGKLRFVYLVMIVAVVLLLIFGTWLNHSLHLQNELLSSPKNGDNNKSDNRNSGDETTNNNLPPKLHRGHDVKHNVDVDDNLVNPIPTHSKPKRNERQRNFEINNNRAKDLGNNPRKGTTKNNTLLRKFPFYFPKNRPPQDTIGDTVDCDTATTLHENLHEHRRLSLIARKQELETELRAAEDELPFNEQKNSKNSKSKESIEDQIVEIDYLLSLLPETKISANPCLRLLMFSTLKPCTSEENVWAQFAAISSWVSIPLHPSPTVVLYDTALRTEFEADDDDDGGKKGMKNRQRKRKAVGEVYNNAVNDENVFVDDKLHETVKVLHKNGNEASFVAEFAQKYGIILSDDDDDSEAANDLKIPPSVTNYSSPSSPFAFDYLEPPASIQSSCGWLLIKMIHKYFRRPTLMPSSKDVSVANDVVVLFPRIALVAPTNRLVGQRHSTLLLGRALHHLEKTVMPALRPSEEGIFDVVAFCNSDIIFNSEHLATILANGMRSLRRFMFIGRRQSLSIDSIMEAIKSGFLDQTSEERKSKESEEMSKRKANQEKRDTGNLGAADGVVSNGEDVISTVPIWHGFSFFDKFFPTKFSATPSTASLPKILFDSPENSRNDRIDAEDYFFWTRGFLDRPHFPFSIPPFHIGRPAFDNWLVNNAIHSNQPVVDITYTHLIAIHVEGSKNRNKMSNGDRAYWGGGGGVKNENNRGEDTTSDTKENYALGESHGGWQHGLLEFAPLKLHMLFDLMKTEREDIALKERIASERKLKRRNEDDNNAAISSSRRNTKNASNVDEKQRYKKIDEEDQNDADEVDNDNSIKYLHHNKNDIRLGMKRKWKGLEGVGKILETPENYWKHIEKNFFFA